MAVYQHVRMWLNQRSIQHIMGHLLSTVHIEIAFTVHFFYFNQTLEKIQSKLRHSCYAPTHLELVQVCFCDERSKTKLVKRLVQLREKFLKSVPFHLNIYTRNGIPEETRTHGNKNCAQRK